MYAVLDPGSDSTLIKRDLADHLQLVGEVYQLNLSTVGNGVKAQRLNRVSFCLSFKDHSEPVMVNGAWQPSNSGVIYQISTYLILTVPK